VGQGGILRWFHEASGKIMEPLKAIISFRPRSKRYEYVSHGEFNPVNLDHRLIYGRESVRVDCIQFTILVKEYLHPCQA
jgi:hypothetical protein